MVPTGADKGWRYKCHRCGAFAIQQQEQSHYLGAEHRSQFFPNRLSPLLKEHQLRGLPVPWLQFEKRAYWPFNEDQLTPGAFVEVFVGDLLARWPRTVNDRLNRALCNLGRLSKRAGDLLSLGDGRATLLMAEVGGEAAYFRAALERLGYTENMGNLGYRVTPRGWARIDELESQGSLRTNPVFVAQWFGGETHVAEMRALYDAGIELAVRQAGYDVSRVDLEQHNDYIMDKVISDIRRAPFVVADFTEHRNGVYFEAGWARGLGLEVIPTCRRDQLKLAHFDTAQLNFIPWDTPADLVEPLYFRIMATVGQGPWPVPEPGEPKAS